MARRPVNIFGLSFLDALTCGFGAVILFYMIINASVRLRSDRTNADLQAEADRLDVEVVEGDRALVELRNSARDVDDRIAVARGLASRILEEIQALTVELANYEGTTLAQREHINRLQADLKSVDEGAKRYSGGIPSDEIPGRSLRPFVGDGDRQYLTGLKVGGQRIFILVDASASMLGDTIVNIVRRRNLPDSVKIKADKWQQAVRTVDWISANIPPGSEFQIYVFNESARPVVEGSDGTWLSTAGGQDLNRAVAALQKVVPEAGTSLFHGLAAIKAMKPRPDNIILLVDGLPTVGQSPPKKSKVSEKERINLYNSALEQLPRGIPVNVILFPMEGDPMAASAFWRLAIATHGSYLSPSRDWP
jgi:hypothetical protein